MRCSCALCLFVGGFVFGTSLSCYASAFRQNSTHFFTSRTAVEPSGIWYSSSMLAGNVHLLFLIVFRTSPIGVSPLPQGRLSEQCAGVVRSFRCRLAIRPCEPYFSSTG